MNQIKPSLWGFIVALVSTAVVLAFHRFIFVQALEMHAPFMPFLAAVLTAAWFGRTRSGLFATALGAGLGIYLSSERPGFHLRPDFQVRLLIFVACGGLTTWLVVALQSARRRIEQRQRQLEHEVVERRNAEIAERDQRIKLAIEMDRREQAEMKLREREERFRMGAESGGIGIWDFNPLTGEHTSSGRSKAMFGLTPNANVNDVAFLERLHPEDRQRVHQAMQEALDPSGDGRYEVEYRTLWPDGTVRWIFAKGEAIFEGKNSDRRAVRGMGTVLDITDRKLAADALEVEREQLRHTIAVQDQERQLIAYEIHDGVIQYATGALIRLEGVHDSVKAEVIADEIKTIVGILRETVAEGRRLINGIRPPVLDDAGIVAAIEQLIEDEDRAHVQLEFVKDEELGRMAPNLEEALYRITQEALTNTRKHSRSTRVRVELGRVGDHVHLEVQDWGVGFTLANGSKNIHGLASMANRARVVGGRCAIKTAPGHGAQIIVDVPYLSRSAATDTD